MQVDIHEAKSQLVKLGELVLRGERVVIAKSGKPYLELVPHRERQEPRMPGRLKGKIHMAEDFDRTPEEVVAAFEEG